MGKGRAISNYFSLSLMQVGNYLLPVITLPIIARVIGVENYGLINYAFAFTGYFMLLINAGFDMYGSRQLTAQQNDLQERNKTVSRIFSAKTILSILASLCFAASIFLVPQLKDHKLLAIVTFIMCFGWVFNPSWLYHAMKDSGKFAAFSFVSKLIFSVLVILLVQSREDFILHPLLYSLSHILFSFFSYRYAMRKYNLKWTWCSWQDLKTTIAGNKQLSFISIIMQQGLPTNIVIAGILVSSLAVGYFSAALRVVMILQAMVAMPLATVLFPYVASSFSKSWREGMSTLGKIFPYLLIFSFVVSAGVFIFSDTIILVLFGGAFSESIGLLQVFAVGLFFSTLNHSFGQQALVNMKKEAVYVRLLVAGAILNILLLPVLINSFGLGAAAWAWTVSEIAVFCLSLVYIRIDKLAGVREFRPQMLVYKCYRLAKVKVLNPYFHKK